VTTNYAVREPKRIPVDATEVATAELFAALDDSSGPAQADRLRARIVEINLPFATRLANRYRNRGQSGEDLAQVAAMALVKAVDGYDRNVGRPFFAYLVPTVLGEVRKHFRDHGWAVHVDRGLQERHLELARARVALVQRLQRPPTVEDLAAELRVSSADVHEAWAAGNAYDYDSLNAPVSPGEEGTERLDFLGGEDPALASAADRLAVRSLVNRLPDRERHILNRYFFGGASQHQIAAEVGMSQMNVSRLLRRTLESLRQQLDGEAGCLPSPPGTATITTQVARGHAVVTVTGDVDDHSVARLRDVMVDTAVRERPRRLTVDLDGVGTVGGRLVRALVDAYRAGGHSGTMLVAINVPAPLLTLLTRLGVTRLFPCRGAVRTTDGRTPSTDGPIDAQADSSGGPGPLGVGRRSAARRPDDALRLRRSTDEELADRRAGAGSPAGRSGRDHRGHLLAAGPGCRRGGRRPARDDRCRAGPGRASLALGCPHRRRRRRHAGRDGVLARDSRPPPILTAPGAGPLTVSRPDRRTAPARGRTPR
jgi:RNA polymerase sigma-B factor